MTSSFRAVEKLAELYRFCGPKGVARTRSRFHISSHSSSDDRVDNASCIN